jgi:hypothetical protein
VLNITYVNKFKISQSEFYEYSLSDPYSVIPARRDGKTKAICAYLQYSIANTPKIITQLKIEKHK